MRARAISLTPNRATVVLRPIWLARLFGARAVVCELEKSHGDWRHVASGKFASGALIRALDFRPIDALPEARTVTQ
jgi:23S rRNA U2552 (ribose-2'-O)-methylase RlmE/FtsJ